MTERNNYEKFLDENKVDYSIFSDDLSYCMGKECKKKTKSINQKIHVLETSKGTRFRLSMQCDECKKRKSIFISSDKIVLKNSNNLNKENDQ